MAGRSYEDERDLAAVTRMWREVGWIDDTDEHADALAGFLRCGDTLVADVHGEAECLVHRSPGSLRHGDHDLPLCAISAVTTSHVGRRQGLASTLMVEALQAGAASGAAVAALGMFDQGYYDRFGFGTGTYEHRLTFDPSTLRVDLPARPPERLTRGDAAEIHALLMRRHRGHGSAVIDPVQMFATEMAWTDKVFALGFRADDGRLTHAVVGSMKAEYGPYVVDWLAYEEPGQLLELLGVLRSLGDQVASMTIREEPADLQLQDLVGVPMRQRRAARIAGGAGSLHESHASMQLRILDPAACIAAVRLDTPPVRFGLRLDDPLAELAAGGWRGIGGEYTVSLGASSEIVAGIESGLPVLEASVNAFSRLWIGVRPASSLSLTDRLTGPPDLIAQLDRALRFPPPRFGWPF
jgi:predicted N-acetyltransferase YhbS